MGVRFPLGSSLVVSLFCNLVSFFPLEKKIYATTGVRAQATGATSRGTAAILWRLSEADRVWFLDTVNVPFRKQTLISHLTVNRAVAKYHLARKIAIW